MMAQDRRPVRDRAPQKEMRRISVCIDDFGLHAGVNDAALRLARNGRVSAVSCLVDGDAWSTGAESLCAMPGYVEIGLHVNLTEPLPGACLQLPLGRLIAAAYMGKLDRGEVESEIRRQWLVFETSMGRAPDFVDGHQHVHQLPVVREALLDVLDEGAPTRRPWLRSTVPVERRSGTAPPWSSRAKALLVATLGARRLAGLAERRGYRHNRGLAGVYDFRASDSAYLEQLYAWLAATREGDLVVCHAATDGPSSDSILPARLREFRVLSGEDFGEYLRRHHIVICPLPSAVPT